MASNVFEAITAVMADVAYVKKEGQMETGQRYKYVQVEDIVAALRPSMVTNGLCLVPTNVEKLLDETYETTRGGKMNRVILSVQYKLAHGPSNTECPVAAIGEAADSGDKCCSKAMTAANKVALRQAFQIETGTDDPDKHASADQERAALPAKANANGKPAAEEEPNQERYAKAMSKITQARDQEEVDSLMATAAKWHAEGWFSEKQLKLLTQQADVRSKGFAMMEKAPY